MSWNLDSNRPIYPQIMERITMDIISGTYPPGSKLPSVRELAQEAGVNPNTMQKSLSELERTGLLYSQRTSGPLYHGGFNYDRTYKKHHCLRAGKRIFEKNGVYRLYQTGYHTAY